LPQKVKGQLPQSSAQLAQVSPSLHAALLPQLPAQAPQSSTRHGNRRSYEAGSRS
jgi:hypothetical protein